VETIFSEMESEAKSLITRGKSRQEVTFSRSLDLCYLGQHYSVNVPIPSGSTISSKKSIRKKFEDYYLSLYGRVYSDIEIQLMNLRLVAQSSAPSLRLPKLKPATYGDVTPKSQRLAYLGRRDKYLEHPVYDRYTLFPGAKLSGPAIIEERESTTIVDSEGKVEINEYGILVITLREEKP
jgi:N-methylhydantoinase A/oxoprolinase/acetone carboxylase beta subunit